MTNDVQLKRLARLIYGEAIPAENHGQGDVPVFGSNGAFSFYEKANTLGPAILVGRKGSFGKINWSDVPCWATDTTFYIDKSSTTLDLRWLYWALQTLELDANSVEAAVPGINREEVYEKRLPKLDNVMQRKTAGYLDAAIGLINDLIAAKQRLLDLLSEKRRALIVSAVTQGLNPAAPMHDSGIEWLGQIPEHWQTENTRWLFKEIDYRSEDGTEELLTVSHLTGVTKRSEKDVNMFLAESNEGYKRCREGDLVINTLWAWMGAMGVARHDGIVSPAYNVYRPRQAFDPDYLDHLVRIPLFVAEITRFSKGVWSSRMRLYPEGLYEASLPVPPLAEQAQIVRAIADQIQHMDALSSATKNTIALLEERRTALIAQAIVGAPENAN
jgi:type I restriction enzyme S subunit